MESNICYICCDKRRSADTDTSQTKVLNSPDAETLKDVLLRALSLGYVDDYEAECQKTKLNGRVCVVSLSRRYDGGLEAVSEKVLNDLVVVCKRCASLLKEFEYHERTLTKIAEEIQNFLARQEALDKEDSDKIQSQTRDTLCRKPVNTVVDEKKGILAALRAFKKSGVSGVKKRGRKRKVNLNPPTETNEDQSQIQTEVPNQDLLLTRTSKRIQQRREDGLVINWGEEPVIQAKSDDVQADLEVLDDDNVFPYQEYKSRKKRFRRHALRIVKSDKPDGEEVGCIDGSGLKYRCPFCRKYYMPSNSKIHNCTSYKNRLRCHLCNIFFTSYIRLEKHFEVIHMKQQQLKCPEEGCLYTCITDPAFVLHKHFHLLENCEGGGVAEPTSPESRTSESSTSQTIVTPTKDSEVASVRVMADLQGELTSPSEADQVSFLLSEKNFLAESNSASLSPEKIVIKKPKEKSLHLKTVTEMEETEGESRNTVGRPIRQMSAIHRSYSYHCPFCDRTLDSQKSFQDHIKNIHSIEMKAAQSRGEGEVLIVVMESTDDVADTVSREGPSIKKNFN